ncbi:hypothetical protein MSI_25960 [Treponema sp. JC4]|uniref:hypothetical protein n=1 Tax=Treponema sp. JC4 TaxID=1124982 RepID=UPI00025B07D4|nr:hypothetical protein [Treponema sp. JC4]EID83984.1 hypothetical protein MSI_25960 [Treponema sp. JC4]
MYIYVVRKIENGSFSKTHCERFSEEIWEEIRKTINPKSIVLVTANIEDLKQFNFEKITWTRFYNVHTKSNVRIKVTLTYDEIQMEEEAKDLLSVIETESVNQWKEVIKKRDEKWEKEGIPKLMEHRNLVEEQNKLIPLDMEEMDAMLKWRELDFITPPPDRIRHIKQTYDMSWREFKEHIKTF